MIKSQVLNTKILSIEYNKQMLNGKKTLTVDHACF